MTKNNTNKPPIVTIHPGENYVTVNREIITTLLGSCVAACLYDPANRVLGMNHFLLAQQPMRHASSILGTDEGRYGIHAMELLINKMLKSGAQRLLLKAKVFGGGDVLKMNNDFRGGKSVGACNCDFIRTFLATEGIPIAAADLGGTQGRTIFFMPDDFSVYVKPIATAGQQAVINEEKRFLEKKSLQERLSVPAQQADFW